MAVPSRRSGEQRPPVQAVPRPKSGSDPELAKRSSALRIKAQPKDVKDRLREGALDTVLNTASILREVWEDFRRQDRYFKYKALIIASWIVLGVVSFFVAFPGSMLDGKNRLGARLVMTNVAGRPVYMIKNDSTHAWKEVTVVANGRFRTAVGSVEANGGTLTFNPKQLKGDHDTSPPADLKISELELRTDDGQTWLIKEGQLR